MKRNQEHFKPSPQAEVKGGYVGGMTDCSLIYLPSE
jgi:hypothetical protein